MWRILIVLVLIGIAGAQDEMPDLDEAQSGEITGIVPLVFGEAMPTAVNVLVQKVDSALMSVASQDDTWTANALRFLGNNSSMTLTNNITGVA